MDILSYIPDEQSYKNRAAATAIVKDQIARNGLRWQRSTTFWKIVPPHISTVHMVSEVAPETKGYRIGVSFFAEAGGKQDLSSFMRVVNSLGLIDRYHALIKLPDPHEHHALVHQPPRADVEASHAKVVKVTLEPGGREQVVATNDGHRRAFTTPSAQGTRIFYEIVATRKIFEISRSMSPRGQFNGITWVENRYLVFDERPDFHYGIHYVVDSEAGRVILASFLYKQDLSRMDNSR